MEEEAGFEARAVLTPGRKRLSRLVLVLPAVALVGLIWAGFSGPRNPSTAVFPQPTAVATRPPAASPRPQPPTTVLGLPVHRLADLEPERYGRDDVVAISGWYVPTAITDCPPVPALYRDGALPYLRGDKDKLAFCVRSGVLYASHPATGLEDRRADAGLSAVEATVVVGVILPIDLELTDAGATEVAIIGRFLPAGAGCDVPAGCRRALIVDYVGWTAIGAGAGI